MMKYKMSSARCSLHQTNLRRCVNEVQCVFTVMKEHQSGSHVYWSAILNLLQTRPSLPLIGWLFLVLVSLVFDFKLWTHSFLVNTPSSSDSPGLLLLLLASLTIRRLSSPSERLRTRSVERRLAAALLSLAETLQLRGLKRSLCLPVNYSSQSAEVCSGTIRHQVTDPCVHLTQLPIVASSMVSLYFLELTDVVQPAQVGFRCHDRELSMPYVDGGDELIPLLMLLSLAFAGPAASVTHTHARTHERFVLCVISYWGCVCFVC